MIERRGPDRCSTDDGFCPLHDHLEQERKEYREMVCSKIASKADAALNAAEHAEIRSDAEAASALAKETQRSAVQWRVILLFATVLIPLLGWMSLSHFSIAERVTQTEVLVKVMFVNQDKLLKTIGDYPHFLLSPAKPRRPEPRRSMVAGSGTGMVAPLVQSR